MKQRYFNIALAVIFIGVAALVARGFLRSRLSQVIPVKSMDSWQQADAPLGFPVNGKPSDFDPRMIQLTAFERLSIPTATQMSAAMGTEHGALTYDAQPFWSNNPQRGGHHTGDDINGIGGMNTDLGDPVYAIGSGLVVYRGEPSPGWGNTLILAHRTPQGKIQLSMYAHLKNIRAAYGDLVPRDEVIATVGTAGLRYPAHLHLEMHDSTGISIGRGYANNPGDRLSPTETIAQHQGAQANFLYQSPFYLLLADQIRGKETNIPILGKKNLIK